MKRTSNKSWTLLSRVFVIASDIGVVVCVYCETELYIDVIVSEFALWKKEDANKNGGKGQRNLWCWT